MSDTDTMPLPAFPFITIDAAGKPALTAMRCTECGTTYADNERYACAKCAARTDKFETFEPSYEGTMHSGAIVMRGYPGIPVPFISAVVDLDDGGPTIKGTLRAETFEPHELKPGRRVKVVFDDALGRTDKDGNHYISHFFDPA